MADLDQSVDDLIRQALDVDRPAPAEAEAMLAALHRRAGQQSRSSCRRPRRHGRWRRLAAAVYVAGVLLTAGSIEAWPDRDADRSYTFDNPAIIGVTAAIRAENEWAAHDDPNFVKIAVLSSMQGPSARESLMGALAAQQRINRSADGRTPRIQLTLTDMGRSATDRQEAVGTISDQLRGAHPVVGVVGLEGSDQETQDVVLQLARLNVPMVAGVLAADGLDATRIPGLLSLSPSNRDYVAALAAYLVTRPEYTRAVLVTDPLEDDLYTRTLEWAFSEQFAAMLTGPRAEFHGEHFGSAVRTVCTQAPQLVFFAGRADDLEPFTEALARNGCRNPRPVVVAAGLARPAWVSRTSMLASTSEDPGRWRPRAQVALSDGIPIDTAAAARMHDAVLTMYEGLRAATGRGLPLRKQLGDALLNLHGDRAVQGIGGTLTFSAANRGRAGGQPVPVLLGEPDEPMLPVTTGADVYRTP